MIQDAYERMDYDAFGNQLNGNVPDPFGYCGEYYDSESGLIYLRNRYYDSRDGRFIIEDPAKDGSNWYSYCADNPIAFVDPSGLKIKGEIIEIGSNNTSDIKYIQEYLNSLGYKGQNGKTLSVDGIFGQNTEYAVKNFQADMGLISDGLVGDKTWSIMLSKPGSLSSTGKPNSTETLYDEDGNIKQIREYDSQGNALKDTDYKHGGVKHTFPHEHIWKDGKRGPDTPVSKPTNFSTEIATGIVTVVGVTAGIVYFFYTGSPDVIYQFAQ